MYMYTCVCMRNMKVFEFLPCTPHMHYQIFATHTRMDHFSMRTTLISMFHVDHVSSGVVPRENWHLCIGGPLGT
jgi:hypothetical protein